MSETPFLPIRDLNNLIRWSNKIAGHYACPIIIGGSAMYKETYRDVDVFAVMPDEDFRIRFGDPVKWEQEGNIGIWSSIRWKWAEECVKRWRHGCKETCLNLDFKIIPESHHLRTSVDLRFFRLDEGPFILKVSI